MRVMEDPSFALFGDALSEKSYDLYKTCQFIEIPKKYGNYPSGFTLPKNSSIGPIFSYYVSRLIESGSVGKIKSVYEKTYGGQVCPNYEGKPIGIYKFCSLFGILITAAILSFVVIL